MFFSLSPSLFSNSVGTKSLAQIQSEIQGVIRQIVASNTFLPVLNSSCKYIYTFMLKLI